MRYVILGAGAIGGTLGGHLHRVGREVVLVARPAHVAAIRAGGLRLLTGDGDYRLQVPAHDSVADAGPFGGEDAVLLCCKAQHTAAALGELRAAGALPEVPIVCCQNAIWNETHAQRVFTNVYGAVVFVPGVYLQPGEVINARVGHYGYVEVGRYPAGTDLLCATLAEDLAAAGFAAAVNPTVMRAKGAKCLGNLANAVTAITGSHRGADAFMAHARDEARRVWRAAGIDFEESDEFAARRGPRYRGSDRWPKQHGTPRRGGSSWQSLVRGAGSIESEFLNGELVQLGRLLGTHVDSRTVSRIISEGRGSDFPHCGRGYGEQQRRVGDASVTPRRRTGVRTASRHQRGPGGRPLAAPSGRGVGRVLGARHSSGATGRSSGFRWRRR